jgi:hypothetical protein
MRSKGQLNWSLIWVDRRELIIIANIDSMLRGSVIADSCTLYILYRLRDGFLHTDILIIFVWF